VRVISDLMGGGRFRDLKEGADLRGGGGRGYKQGFDVRRVKSGLIRIVKGREVAAKIVHSVTFQFTFGTSTLPRARAVAKCARKIVQITNGAIIAIKVSNRRRKGRISQGNTTQGHGFKRHDGGKKCTRSVH
jgi:hypothetical protein